MLYTDPVTESTLDDYTKVYGVPGPSEGYDPHARAFHWGGLTAGSWQTAFWILLAPFAFANVAGWLVSKRNRWTIVAVRLAALTLTALFASQVVHAVLVLHAWIPGRGLPDWLATTAIVVLFAGMVAFVFWVGGLLSLRSHFSPLDFSCRIRLLLFPSQIWMQHPPQTRDQEKCEPHRGNNWTDPRLDWSDPAFAGQEDESPWLADGRLWRPHSIIYRMRRCHFAVAMGIVALALTETLGATVWPRYTSFVVVGIAYVMLIGTTLSPGAHPVLTITAWLPATALANVVVAAASTALVDAPIDWSSIHRINLIISIVFGITSAAPLIGWSYRAVGALAIAAFFGGAMGIAAVTVLEELTRSSPSSLNSGAGWVAVWMLVMVLVLIFVACAASLPPMSREPQPRPLPPAPWPFGLSPDEKETRKRMRQEWRSREIVIRLRRVVGRAKLLLASAVVVGIASAVAMVLVFRNQGWDPSSLLAEDWGYVPALPIALAFALGVALWPFGGLVRYATPLVGLAIIVAGETGFIVPGSNMLEFTFLRVNVNVGTLVGAALAVAVLIPAGWIIASIISGARDGEKRRRTGLIWDVASFWPRYFHPLSPPPYGPNAVNEMIEEIEKVAKRGERITVSAHSQGSVVTTVALRKLDPGQAAAVEKVITYGSPIALIYARLFGETGLAKLVEDRAGLSKPWFNLWRASDYLGGMPLPLPDADHVNFEADGVGHSNYERTNQFRQLKTNTRPIDPPNERGS
jgi:MFS family permease